VSFINLRASWGQGGWTQMWGKAFMVWQKFCRRMLKKGENCCQQKQRGREMVTHTTGMHKCEGEVEKRKEVEAGDGGKQESKHKLTRHGFFLKSKPAY
jgi:hypothetical protein